MPQTITIELPDKLYWQLERAAQLTRQPTATIVEQSLAHSLPPLLEEIPPRYQSDVYPLLQMTDAELQKEVNRTFPPECWAAYEALLDKKKISPLSGEEQKRLDDLRDQANVTMFRRAYAAVLLKRRTQASPPDVVHRLAQELEHSK
ncbi:MAG TPA: hypothetical protein ENN19_19310 [Chloroflexi bacterium]|nr:hypothetical protein [Chloroflexota bacterium]